MRRECWERFLRHWLQRQPLVSIPGMHHGTWVMHVPWFMSGSLTYGGGENVPGILAACVTRKFTYPARGPWHTSLLLAQFMEDCGMDKYIPSFMWDLNTRLSWIFKGGWTQLPLKLEHGWVIIYQRHGKGMDFIWLALSSMTFVIRDLDNILLPVWIWASNQTLVDIFKISQCKTVIFYLEILIYLSNIFCRICIILIASHNSVDCELNRAIISMQVWLNLLILSVKLAAGAYFTEHWYSVIGILLHIHGLNSTVI